jgi:THAP domain
VWAGSNLNKENLELFNFPKENGRRKKWIIFKRNCRADTKWKPTNHSKFCGRHFVPEDFVYALKDYRKEAKLRAALNSINHNAKCTSFQSDLIDEVSVQ